MKRIAVLFSGQGSQYVGMGRKLHERDEGARRLFEEASDVLGMDMARLCFESAAEDLNRTENTQPALLLCSVADYRSFFARTGVTPAFVAGHSLGELSALVAAETISLSDGLRMGRTRGLAMSRCNADGAAGMQAITQLDGRKVEEICRSVDGFGSDFVIANFNAESQVVLSGRLSALERAGDALKKAGGVVIPLKVSGPFHSPFMSPAADEFAAIVAGIEFKPPRIPVVSNVTAQLHDGDIAQSLVRQITSPVQWTETMKLLHREGMEIYLEAGPRAVLKKLAQANVPGATAYALDEDDDRPAIENAFAAEIRAVKERPSLVTKCMAVAVCTRNGNWDGDAYQRGVVEPYRQLQAMQEQLERDGKQPGVGEMRQALDLLARIFATKGTTAEEREWRLAQILDTTGARELLGSYAFPETV